MVALLSVYSKGKKAEALTIVWWLFLLINLTTKLKYGRDFFLTNLMSEDPLLIWVFEIGRHTFNPDLLSWENPPLVWAAPSGSLYKGIEERYCSLPYCSHITGKSIPLLALEPTSLGSHHILKSRWDIVSLMDWATTGFLDFLLTDSMCWFSWIKAYKSFQ